jgi:hypothetical protein
MFFFADAIFGTSNLRNFLNRALKRQTRTLPAAWMDVKAAQAVGHQDQGVRALESFQVL